MAVTHPPSGIGGSTPSRRIYGDVVLMVSTRDCLSFRAGSSPVVIAGIFDNSTCQTDKVNKGGSSNGRTPGLHPGNRGSNPRPVHFDSWGLWSNGKTPARHAGNPGSILGNSTYSEGNRIGLGNWLLTSRLRTGVGGFDSPTFRFEKENKGLTILLRSRDGPPATSPEVKSYADIRDHDVAAQTARSRTIE